MTVAPVLTTERLILRPLQLEDFERFAQLFATPRSKFVGGPRTREAVWNDFAADAGQWSLLGFGSWAVEHRESGEHVGHVGLNFPVSFPERELGWLL